MLTKEEKRLLKSIDNPNTKLRDPRDILIKRLFERYESSQEIVLKLQSDLRNLKDDIGSIHEINIRYDQHIQARSDTIERAMDQWGLEYAFSSDGLYPHGHEIGRRSIIPEDLGRTSWHFDSIETTQNIINTILHNDAFLIVTGFSYKPLSPDKFHLFKGCRITPDGLRLSFKPTDKQWKERDGWYIRYTKIPIVLPPTCRMELQTFFMEDVDHVYGFRVEGDVIAKRSYLMLEPEEILRLVKK